MEEVVDKDYKSYFIWFVDFFKYFIIVVFEKDLLVKVKVEIEFWFFDDDDDDVIEVSDILFIDGESIFFVVFKSKEVIDFEKDDSIDDESDSNCVFRKELMDVFEKLYDVGELLLFFV